MDSSTFLSGARSVCLAAAFGLAGQPASSIALGTESSEVAITTAGSGATTQQTQLLLRYAQFDPLERTPPIPIELRAAGDPGVYIVQLRARSSDEARRAIRNAGGRIGRFLPEHAYIVRMDARAADAVRALPSVRWVGPYHPAYKLDEPLLQAIVLGSSIASAQRYSIQMLDRGAADQNAVAGAIAGLGGIVQGQEPRGYRIEATLTLDQLRSVAQRSEVLFIDAKGAPGEDMDMVRLFSGGDVLHDLGFSGQGVRGEVLDGGLRLEHRDFQARPPIIHGANSVITSHGTSVYGIVFGDGTGDERYTGMLPEAQGIFASYTELGFLGEAPTRYEHTAELVDETGPYRAVFQTNSWGDPRTRDYTTISAQMDDIAFLYDILITQSQSNSGRRDSRPQAWAKNIVSVGGIEHYETATRIDDAHHAASTGPAADGRIKPDLAHFYDRIETTSSAGETEYTVFNGTSASTPIVAGHFGVLFQLWGAGAFNNVVRSDASVFENRPASTTARALMINTAQAWTLSDAIGRAEQGWGAPDVWRLYNARRHLFVVNQTYGLVRAGDCAEFLTDIDGPAAPLRITMAYLDPAGNPAARMHRINDLDLRVTSPSGVVYHGNVGLDEGAFSSPGGQANRVDTIENVFIKAAERGRWTVEVIASELNEDADLSTPELDAHFALVIQGGSSRVVCRADFDMDGSLTLFDFIAFQAAFDGGDPRADFDGDGELTMFDYLAYQARFAAGC